MFAEAFDPLFAKSLLGALGTDSQPDRFLQYILHLVKRRSNGLSVDGAQGGMHLSLNKGYSCMTRWEDAQVGLAEMLINESASRSR